MRKRVRFCSVCGRAFVSRAPHEAMCSAECRAERHRQQAAKSHDKRKAESLSERRKNANRGLRGDAMTAKELGLSYGELSALKRFGEIRTKDGRRLIWDGKGAIEKQKGREG